MYFHVTYRRKSQYEKVRRSNSYYVQSAERLRLLLQQAFNDRGLCTLWRALHIPRMKYTRNGWGIALMTRVFVLCLPVVLRHRPLKWDIAIGGKSNWHTAPVSYVCSYVYRGSGAVKEKRIDFDIVPAPLARLPRRKPR